MKHTLLILFFLVLGVLSFLGIRHWVTAQVAGQALEVSPPSQEVKGDPGQTITIKSKLRNKTNDSLPIRVHIEDFTASGDEGQVALTQGGQYAVSAWTKVTPETFSLAPGDEKEVTATVTIPKNAAGGRYGSFVFGVDTKAPAGSNTTALSQAIASLFLIRISGPVNESLELTKFTAPQFSEFGPIPISLTFQNNGNVFTKTYGLVNITDSFNNRVADIVVPATNVFPNASRVVVAKLNKQLLIGSFTATAVMTYGSENQPLTQTTHFIVFPVRIAGGILVFLIILFLIRKRLTKAMKALFG